MGMSRKLAAGALTVAGLFAAGSGAVFAQDNQNTNRDTTNQTTTQDRTTSQDSNRTTQDSNRTSQDTNRTTQDSNQSTTQGTDRDSNRSAQGTNQDANRATGQQVTSRGGSNTGGAGMLSSSDRKFVMDAAMGGMLEVEAGRLASQQGSSDAVKQIGAMLVEEHTKANEELKTLAASKGITLPQELDAKHRATLTKMSSLSGAQFDRAFLKEMQKDHKKDISMFQKQADKGADADLKAFAAKTLPALREHGQMIDQAVAGGGGGMRNTSGSGSSSGTDNSSGTTSRPNSGTSNQSNTGSGSGSGTGSGSSTGTSSGSGTDRPSNSGSGNQSGSGTRPNP